ncbi:MAG: YceD family protein [Chthonomonadales bacterium]
MKLDLSEIIARVGMHYAYQVDEPALVDEDLECTSRITGRLNFTNTGGLLLVQGELHTRIALECSRCLVYFEEPIDAPISEQFTLETRSLGPHSRVSHVVVEEDENPSAGRLFSGNVLDLTELLRQTITVAAPLQPLHDPQCRGLCPVCGQDRNEAECSCESQEVNPAFAKLQELLKGPISEG